MTHPTQGQKIFSSLPASFFMTDDVRCPDAEKILKTLPPDCGVIFRNYAEDNREDKAATMARLCNKYGLVFLVAGDGRLAKRVGADGVHLPEWHLSSRPLASQIRTPWIVTAAAHNIAAINRANQMGVNAVLLAPAFATESHPNRAALGPHRLQRLARYSHAPVYALGGVSRGSLKQLLALPNVNGFAAISYFME